MANIKNKLKITINKEINKANYLIIKKEKKLNKYKFFTKLLSVKINILKQYKNIKFKFPLVFKTFNLFNNLKLDFFLKNDQSIIFVKLKNFVVYNNIKFNMIKLENKKSFYKILLSLSNLNFKKLKEKIAQ